MLMNFDDKLPQVTMGDEGCPMCGGPSDCEDHAPKEALKEPSKDFRVDVQVAPDLQPDQGESDIPDVQVPVQVDAPIYEPILNVAATVERDIVQAVEDDIHLKAIVHSPYDENGVEYLLTSTGEGGSVTQPEATGYENVDWESRTEGMMQSRVERRPNEETVSLDDEDDIHSEAVLHSSDENGGESEYEPIQVGDRATLYLGDCVEVLSSLPDNSIDSIVCDPPYGLNFMGKDFDNPAKMIGQMATGKEQRGAFAYGGSHDQGLFNNDPHKFQAWSHRWAVEVLRVLKPGGHMLAFGGTRTYHRLASAIEDAGFEIRDQLQWLYGCLTDDAEILTENGWKIGVEVEVGERVAQWSEGEVNLAPVLDKYLAPYDGKMVRFRNHDTDQILTPNHRVYHRSQERVQVNGVRKGEWSDWKVEEAGRINRWQPMRLPLGGEHHGDGIGGEDYAALLGWVWTEGGFDNTGTGVRIWQSSVNPTKVTEIACLLDNLVPDHKRYDRDRIYKGRAYTETCWYWSGEMAERVRGDLPDKHPSYDLIWRMTMPEKQAFWRAAMAGDGSGYHFYQKSEEDLIWAQTLLAMMGQRGQLNMRKNRPGGMVTVTPRPETELQARHLKDAEVEYQGDVWCVSVPSGAFVARRNGQVFVTGNSGFPKGQNIAPALEKKGFDAQKWQGWNTALKPANEPIVLARKPLDAKTIAANVMEWGTGALNIDATRVDASGGRPHRVSEVRDDLGTEYESNTYAGRMNDSFQPGSRAIGVTTEGRWPANVILDEEAAELLDEQTGILKSGKPAGGMGNPHKFGKTLGQGGGVVYEGMADGSLRNDIEMKLYGDEGGASRFFYTSKVSKWERNHGLDRLPDAEKYQDFGLKQRMEDGEVTNTRTNKEAEATKNNHPTVKPVALMAYLCRLVTPEGGVVLDPFMGSGSTGIAALLEGFNFLGIEMDPNYMEIAKSRIGYWADQEPDSKEVQKVMKK